ncbi:hypothetical protein COLO4_36152 [Corchorus olitorius]|uniref:RNase H type-1 domain-containing protein n=1 Tax=Corchorus olitorius TaxID=93759 RepID=A0A1R3GAU4_9ROSI|nr:hypothetical protein COLO4_36152 [Corchorus olitorius]
MEAFPPGEASAGRRIRNPASKRPRSTKFDPGIEIPSFRTTISGGIVAGPICQQIEYEGLDNICFTCGRYGHTKESPLCPQMHLQSPTTPTQETPTEDGGNAAMEDDKREEASRNPSVGPWMTVQRKKGPSPSKKGQPRADPQAHNKASGSKFSALQNEEDPQPTPNKVYGSPSPTIREDRWTYLKEKSQNITGAWTVGEECVISPRKLVATSEWKEIQSRDKLDKPKVLIYHSWDKPTPTWIKLNTDGSWDQQRNIAAAGGIFRDCQGRWLTGFGLNIGNCSIDSVELWAIYHGVKYARQMGMDFVEIESDSNNSVLAIKQGVSINHPLAPLVNAIKEFLTNDWHWKMEYIPREKNMAADWLAKWSCNQNRGLHLLCRPPTGLGNVILADCVGAGHPRLVTN